MKVYFNASPSQLDKYRPIYQRIGKCIEDLGHQLTSRWILDFDESFFNLDRPKWNEHYKQIIQSIDDADVVIWDISVSSTTGGQCIQHGLESRKPVIALRDNNSSKNIFLVGAGEVESKLLIVEYNQSDLETKLTEALDYVEDWLETRFTLIIDGETRRLLDKAATNGITRSDYIRELIRKDAEK